MAIKMRNNKDLNSVCCECGDPRKEVLGMYDVCVGGNIFTICDRCNEELFYKTLRAECAKNARVKSPKDMQIIRKRASGNFNSRWHLRMEEERLAAARKGLIKEEEENNEHEL